MPDTLQELQKAVLDGEDDLDEIKLELPRRETFQDWRKKQAAGVA